MKRIALLATGGTALAAAKLVEQMGGEVISMCFALELASEFDAREVLKDYEVHTVLCY